MYSQTGLETKFHKFDWDEALGQEGEIKGYASLFSLTDQGGDVVEKGAFKESLAAHRAQNFRPKMLWQHDAAQPIGIWDAIIEDEKGLFVKGRILTEIQAGREALALIRAGAIDGLSIGYKTQRATKGKKGQRHLTKVELWEVSLVTFPMLPKARVDQDEPDQLAHELVDVINAAREELLA